MKQQLLIILTIVIGLVLYILRKKKKVRRNIAPSSLSGGIQYIIPYAKKDRFYIGLPGRKAMISMNDLLQNKVTHENIEYTQVLFDGVDLQANSMINYTALDHSHGSRVPKTVHIFLAGNLDPSQVCAQYYGHPIQN